MGIILISEEEMKWILKINKIYIKLCTLLEIIII